MVTRFIYIGLYLAIVGAYDDYWDPPTTAPPFDPDAYEKKQTYVIAGVTVGTMVLLCLCSAFSCFHLLRDDGSSSESQVVSGGGVDTPAGTTVHPSSYDFNAISTPYNITEFNSGSPRIAPTAPRESFNALPPSYEQAIVSPKNKPSHRLW